MGCGASSAAEAAPPRAAPTPAPKRPPPGVVLNEPGHWDVFISHTQRNPNAKLLASELYSSLREKGVAAWLDVKMEDMGEAAMREGVENSDLCLAIITDGAGKPGNAYFEREYCLKELRWAVEAGVPIQPLIDIKDKDRVGEFVNSAPEDLRHIGGTQFFELYRGNPKLWDACVSNIVRALEKSPKRRRGAAAAFPPAPTGAAAAAAFPAADDTPPAPAAKRTLGQLSSFSRRSGKRDSQLTGIDDDDLDDMQLPDVVTRKLENPNLELTVDQRLDVLERCIAAGRQQAKRAIGKQLIMVIGNTGAGKSTACNYLHGCQMETFRPTEDADKAVRVREDSSPPELMVIGHTNKSATFMPKIAGGDAGLTFADCPGFLDNRGAEINIANAANIREAVARADSIRVMIVLNYHSLKADRGKGVRDLAQILIDLFGDAARVRQHAASVVLGLSRAPIFDEDGDKLRFAYFRKLASDTTGLGEDAAAVVEALASRMFVFDPLDRGDGSWRGREQIMEDLRALPAITDPGDVFRTVLTAEDERALRGCVHELEGRLRAGMENGAYDAVATTLRQLSALEGVNNPLVVALLGRAREQVVVASTRLKDEVVRSAMSRSFDDAEGHMEELRRAAGALSAGGRSVEDLARRVDGMAREAEAVLLRMREDERERARMYEELRSAHDRQEAMQRQLERLEARAREDRELAEAQQAALKEAQAASERERERMAEAFEEQKRGLEERMAKASEEDARKMREEIARLEAERTARDREAREEAARRERELREQAEESARRAAEAEREKAALQAEQAKQQGDGVGAGRREAMAKEGREEEAQQRGGESASEAIEAVKKAEKADDVEAVVAAMQRHADAAGVQEAACWALRNLSLANDANDKRAGDAGGVEAVVAAMRRHADAAGVQEAACWALRNLPALDNANDKRAGDAGGVEAVVAAMRRHADAAGVQEAACWALIYLSIFNDANRKRAGDAGGVEAVVAAMRRHAEAAEVQAPACAALGNLSYMNDANKKRAGDAGGVEALVAAMRKHFGSATVQEEACGALRNLSSTNDANRKRAGDAGAAELAEAAMRRHSTHDGVQREASDLLDRLRG